jgi:hypothetical protein
MKSQMGKWQTADSEASKRRRLLVFAICPFAICHFSACCVERADSVERYGEPDLVYELRGATGRWYWYGDEAPARSTQPDEVGFIWLKQDHQVIFAGDCQCYDGPVRSDDWRRFEQARIEEVEEASKTP